MGRCWKAVSFPWEAFWQEHSNVHSETITECQLGFSTSQLHTTSTGLLKLEPQNTVPANGLLVIAVPNQWTNTIVTGQRILSQNLSCTSNVTGSDQPINCSTDILGTALTIQLPLQYSSVLLIKLTNLLSPPTSLQEQTVKVASYSSSSDLIDDFTVCTLSVPQPTNLSLNILTPTTFVVATNFTPTFNFSSIDLINVDDLMEVNVSAGVLVLQNTPLTITTVQAGLSYNSTADINTALSNISNGRLVYTLKRLSNRAILPTNSTVMITGLKFQAPSSIQPLQPFITLGLLRNTSYYCSSTTNLTASPNTPTNISVTSANSTVSINTTYTIKFSLSTAISTQGRVTVRIPVELNPYNLSQTCGNLTINGILQSSANCSVANNLLTVTLNASIAANSAMMIGFNGTNPSSEKPTSTFQITTYFDSSAYSTDYNDTLAFVANASVITSIQLTRINSTVGANTTYTFMYTSLNSLAAGSQLTVQLCPEIAFSNSVQVLVNGSQVNSTVNTRNVTINITNNITKNSTSNITIVGLFNANSTKATSSLVVEATIGGYRVEAMTTGLQLIGGTPAAFAQLPAITPSSSRNGQWNSYNLTLSPSVTYANGTKLQLTVPSQISLSTNISCSTGSGFNTALSAKC